jgi:hypothetical protein
LRKFRIFCLKYCEIWLAYFSELSTVPPKFDKKIEELNEKVKELEEKPEFKSFFCLDFRISASELNKAICNLKNGKSPGLDMFVYYLLPKLFLFIFSKFGIFFVNFKE